jgi:hypothetical protein
MIDFQDGLILKSDVKDVDLTLPGTLMITMRLNSVSRVQLPRDIQKDLSFLNAQELILKSIVELENKKRGRSSIRTSNFQSIIT